MRVRLTQLDGKLPNIALMRLAAWHRARGDEITFTRRAARDMLEGSYDRVYGSAIFTMSIGALERLKNDWPHAIIGGTGTPSKITVEDIIGINPIKRNSTVSEQDYSLYPDFKASIGFSQRGCRLSCKFCVVPSKEGKPQDVADIAEIWRGEPWPKNIHLLDNDFFGQLNWQRKVAEIRDGKFLVCFNQGINVRLVTDEVAAALASIRYRDDQFKRPRLYTAWDNLKDESVFFTGVDRLERAGIPPRHLMAYMLTGFAKGETMELVKHRFNRMVERGIFPYPMVYDNSRRDLKAFQRWAVTGIYRAGIPFEEYQVSARAKDPRQASFAMEAGNG